MTQLLIPDRAAQTLLHSVINQEAKDIQMRYAELGHISNRSITKVSRHTVSKAM